MNVVLSFIGKMPDYIYDCVKQLRLFYKGSIYVIYDDISDGLFSKLSGFNITYVHYDKVRSQQFENKMAKRDFAIVDSLKDRRLLFKRSFERFYLLCELMKLYKLEKIWFMELDILMYVDPNKFSDALSDVPIAFAYHRPEHCNSGIFYVRDVAALLPVLDSFDNFNNGFVSEMRALCGFSTEMGVDKITFFPLTFPNNEHRLFWKDYDKFNGHLFDGAIMGMYYFGIDPVHTGGVIKKLDPNAYDLKGRFMNFWNHGSITWSLVEGLYIPYFKVKGSDKTHPVANLHIHSKDLLSAVSYRETV